VKYVIDTHALIWFLEGNPRLGSNAQTILSNPESQIIIPATALAEAVWIVERGRTSISSATALLSAVNADTRVIVYPLDTNVIQQTIGLSAIGEMHARQIVATAIVLANQGETVVLLTCDQNIIASGLVTIVW
jgi:PIN domain nuclease of toxin-antitoxin system